MKRIILNIVVILSLFYCKTSFSQTLEKPLRIKSQRSNSRRPQRLKQDEFINRRSPLKDIFTVAPCYVNCNVTGSEGDLRFTTSSSFNVALSNHNLIVRAARRTYRAWHSKQLNIIKNKLEAKFGKKFSNYNEAKNMLFADSERKNIIKCVNIAKPKYSNLKSSGFRKQKEHKKKLKLLRLRENEIKAGNINNSKYGFIKVGNVYLKDLKSTKALKKYWDPLVSEFSKNTAITHVNNYIYKAFSKTGVNNIVVSAKNNYYNRLNDRDKLDFMQFLINYEYYKKYNSPPYAYSEEISKLFKKFNKLEVATPSLVENYAIKNRDGGISVFDAQYYYNLLDIYSRPPALPGSESMAIFEWETVKNKALDKLIAAESTPKNTLEFLQQEKPDYFGQIVSTTNGASRIHENAIAFNDANGNAFAFITPDEKFFFWVHTGTVTGWFLEGGIYTDSKNYQYYVLDKYNRNSQPISWGIHRASEDLGGSIVNLVSHPNKAISDFSKGILKIISLDFDINKTWERIINADLSDASYVVSTLALAHLAGPKGKGLVAAPEVPNLQNLLAQYASKAKPGKLTWPQVMNLFLKGRVFEQYVSSHLKTIYKSSNGYSVFNQVYLKVDGVVSIVDDLIYNTNTKKFILNETKYGIHNVLSKNQRILQNAIKAGRKIEVRSKGPFIDVNGKTIDLLKQGESIGISEILRSHNLSGIIDANTLKTIWKK
ncbi:hypothetical protein [Tenacibaculum ovolyticum]|uniref:hypothetical protein n=1 Tax=Tenacibaculum ovolyticum TaxID=104270 RepID=UPI00041D5E36|nr:hypothetical protein [Tenacibaculum ovolyticum]